ncbi:MAG TPA: HAMP domain-containing sensor histidine kinase [Gaiellaceae bacterium]|nr:HAMP domain-containing sensor histidine kinase [Gaiellaceae bacterium]
MNPLRSVGGRLALGLALVVAGALLLADLIVVPSLERHLVDSKLSQLRHDTPAIATRLSNSPDYELHTSIVKAAQQADARVIYFTPQDFSRKILTVFDDSNPVTSADVENDPYVVKAFDAYPHYVSGTVTSGGKRYAEVGFPLRNGAVVLVRASLRDTLQSISQVRRRLVIAGLIALAASLAVGYAAAALFARRIRRLERAADRIAAGDFSEPVVDRGRDELGQLAVAFDHMRQRLAQLEHARREFIANASHELRTPLFSLGGFLEIMDDEELDPATQAEFMATMREQVARLTKLATDLLDLSRLDAGRMTIEHEQVDLVALAEVLADEFRGVALSTGHELAVENGAESRAVGDEERALQIGRILLENAMRHTPPGTPVRIAATQRNGNALLTVEDEGPGIPAEHAGQVFERFYRLEGSIASGSGLGLAIARELAELMGGSLKLQTQAGRTLFSLVLPSDQSSPEIPRENEDISETGQLAPSSPTLQ